MAVRETCCRKSRESKASAGASSEAIGSGSWALQALGKHADGIAQCQDVFCAHPEAVGKAHEGLQASSSRLKQMQCPCH